MNEQTKINILITLIMILSAICLLISLLLPNIYRLYEKHYERLSKEYSKEYADITALNGFLEAEYVMEEYDCIYPDEDVVNIFECTYKYLLLPVVPVGGELDLGEAMLEGRMVSSAIMYDKSLCNDGWVYVLSVVEDYMDTKDPVDANYLVILPEGSDVGYVTDLGNFDEDCFRRHINFLLQLLSGGLPAAAPRKMDNHNTPGGTVI